MNLGKFLLAAILGLALLLALIFTILLGSSRQAVERTAEQLRRAASAKASEHVGQALSAAENAVDGLEAQLEHEIIGPEKGLETALYGLLLGQPTLTEMTFTWPQGQLSLARAGGEIVTRRWKQGDAGDPMAHLTYSTPADPSYRGQALWSALSWSEQDARLPPERRRVVMTVQKAVWKGDYLIGVARAGMLSDDIDRIGRMRLDEDDAGDPHRIFLCDRAGHLITRLSPGDTFAVDGDDLRVVAHDIPPAIAAALADPATRLASAERPAVVRHAGDVVTVFPLRDDRTHGWLVGVAVPEAYYLGGLTAARNRLLLAGGLLAAAVLAGGALSLRAVRAGLLRVVDRTARMRRFDFAPAPAASAFTDVRDALHSLEVAKTALRAMGRYVPIDLVRELYREGREPTLGGELVDLSLMFTDIQDFTTVSERLSPDELAAALGAYLQVMTTAIAETGGTIDKFIGDAVMVFWNAPLPAADHAARACRAALGCQQALRALFASPAWAGLPPFTTRFGLHRATVMVGHFGAPERLSYTALGDGVNLASRLEGQNKAYGTTILASQALVDAAGEGFHFRRVDEVVVKGKTAPVIVYELSENGPAPPP